MYHGIWANSHSYLLQNDGTGNLDVTDKYSKELSQVGMVTNAIGRHRQRWRQGSACLLRMGRD
jgi:hypothetical protein